MSDSLSQNERFWEQVLSAQKEKIMIRKTIFALLTLCLLTSLVMSPVTAQSQDEAVKPYVKPDEYAHALKPVRIGSTVYDVYYISSEKRQIYTDGSLFTHWFSDSVDRWEDQLDITGMLVLSNGVPVRDEGRLFEVMMLSAAEIYTQMNINEQESLPQEAIDNIDKFFDDKYQLRKIAFAEQEIQQLFKSDVECYATMLRMMMAADSALTEDAPLTSDMIESFVSGAESVEGTAERLASFLQYNNNKVVREKFTRTVRDLLDQYRDWQDSGKRKGWRTGSRGAYDLEINGVRVSGQIALDLLKLAVRFQQMQAASAERVDMLRSISEFAHSNPNLVQMDPALLTAVDLVIQEADSASFNMTVAIVEFVRDKAVNAVLSDLENEIAKEWAHFAFKHWGTRIWGHWMAGAASGIFLGYAISNLAFGLDGVYANTYNARYAQLTRDAFGQLAHTIRTSMTQSTAYVESSTVAPYRASYALSKFAEIEFYKALAERSTSVWSLKIIIDLFSGNSMSEGIEEARDYAKITAKYLLPYWVTPPLINRAVELALTRARLGAGETSTVLVVDLSGSMDHRDPSGSTKIEAAKSAAIQLINQLGQDNTALGMAHEVAIVGFSDDAHVAAGFSLDTAALADVASDLHTINGTNLGAGFELANSVLRDEASGDAYYVILMTDGVPSVGLQSLNDFLSGPVAEAESLGACVMAVAFGADANESLLRGIAEASSCGEFFYAANAFQLRTSYAQAAAQATGENVQTFFGEVAEGETVQACTYDVGSNQSVASFYLLWLGSTLELQLTEPGGRRVEPDGDRIQLVDQGPNSRRVLVKEPKPGTWSVGVVGVDVPDGGEPFSVIASTVPSTGVVSGGGGLGVAVVLLAVAIGGVFIYAARQKRPRATATQTTMRAVLVGLSGQTVGRQPVVLKDSFLLGRGSACDVRIPDRAVSRQHARIRHAQGAWFLQDQGSAIGTYVNGQRVQAIRLNHGDRIAIGNTEFEFRIG